MWSVVDVIISSTCQMLWPSGFREDESANQKQELPMLAMFVNGSGRYEQCL
jgi:hypothetical protein